MSLKKYQALTYSVELGTLTKAGEKLGASQTAITHLILDLEKQVGFKLITRGKKGVSLAEKGKKVYPYIKEVVLANQNLLLNLQKIKTETATAITVGTFSSVAVNWLPVIINGFKKLHPEVTFNIIDGGYGDILNALSSGVADIGFISTDGNEPNTYPLISDKILVLLPNGHKYANINKFPISYLRNEPIISLSENTDFDSRRVFKVAGITPDIRYRTADDYAMISMVENELGICLMPELLIGNRASKVVIKELTPPQFRTIALKTANNVSPLVEEFKNYVISWVKENYKF
jgi:DNA-binding transcriptional LysR family regulator